MLLDEFDEIEKKDYVFICFRRKLLDEVIHNIYDYIPKIFPDWNDYDRKPLVSRIYEYVRNDFDNDYSIAYSREYRMGLVEHPEYDTEKLENEREYYSKILVIEYLRRTIRSIRNMIQENKNIDDIARISRVPVSSVIAICNDLEKRNEEDMNEMRAGELSHETFVYDDHFAAEWKKGFEEGYTREFEKGTDEVLTGLIRDGLITQEQADKCKNEVMSEMNTSLHERAERAYQEWLKRQE